LSETKEIVDVDDHVVPMQGAIPLDDRRDATPRERGQGPAEGGSQFPIIVALERDGQETTVDRVYREVPKSDLGVRDGPPCFVIRTFHNVRHSNHVETRWIRRCGISGISHRSRSIGNKPELPRLTRFGDEGKGHDPGRNGTRTDLGAQEMTSADFALKVFAKGIGVVSSAIVVLKNVSSR
jgi:hypothetical protein